MFERLFGNKNKSDPSAGRGSKKQRSPFPMVRVDGNLECMSVSLERHPGSGWTAEQLQFLAVLVSFVDPFQIEHSHIECESTEQLYSVMYPLGGKKPLIATSPWSQASKRQENRGRQHNPPLPTLNSIQGSESRWFYQPHSPRPEEWRLLHKYVCSLTTLRSYRAYFLQCKAGLADRWTAIVHKHGTSHRMNYTNNLKAVEADRSRMIAVFEKAISSCDKLESKSLSKIASLTAEFSKVLQAWQAVEAAALEAKQTKERAELEARNQEKARLVREREYREAAQEKAARVKREAAERQRQLEEERQKHAAEMERQRIQREHEQRQNQQWLANNLHRYNMKLERQTRWDALMAEKRSEAEFMPFTPAESDIREAAEYEYNVWLNANPQFNAPDPDPAWMQMKGY